MIQMTQNQIAYQANLERERHNRVSELQSSREIDVKRDTQEAQEQRWKHQNATDTAKAVTGGIKDVLSGIGAILPKGGKK